MLFNCLMANTGVAGPYMESLGTAEARSLALRVKLRIVDPRLALVPWELIYEDRFGEYMALSHDTPVVRYAEAAQPQTPLAVKSPLRILGIAVSPTDVPSIDLAAQKKVVETALANLIVLGSVELVWMEGGTWRDLQRAMRSGGPWHILHFIGHGIVDSASGEGTLVFADDDGNAQLLAASQLGRILANHASLRLVLLNACHGATSTADNLYTSAAATLTRRGLPAVIAMQFAILEKAGVELARTFYEALADGLSVEGALTEARIAVSLAHSGTVDWAAPVLYLRAPDGMLFEVEREGQKRHNDCIHDEPNGAAEDLNRRGQPTVERLIVPNVHELRGAQLRAAMDAIGSAYSTRSALAKMVKFYLRENLESIVGGSSLDDVIFNLLEWARMRGRTTELLQGAVDANPTNPELREFIMGMQ